MAGAGSAARNTARFSVAFFLVGFASPGLRRWAVRLPEAAALFYAFFAAHFVHFAAVLLLHTRFGDRTAITLPQVVIVVAGVTITAMVGMTAGRGSRVSRTLHLFSVYVIFLILAADYSQHPTKSMRWMAVPVFASLVVRLLAQRKPRVVATAT